MEKACQHDTEISNAIEHLPTLNFSEKCNKRNDLVLAIPCETASPEKWCFVRACTHLNSTHLVDDSHINAMCRYMGCFWRNSQVDQLLQCRSIFMEWAAITRKNAWQLHIGGERPD
jgi:hypothetical protein